jgi:hypothetical protein
VDSDTIATLIGVGFVCFLFFGVLYKCFKSYPCCPFCREIIDPNAKRCPNCTSQLGVEIPIKKPSLIKIDGKYYEQGSQEYHLAHAEQIVRNNNNKNKKKH